MKKKILFIFILFTTFLGYNQTNSLSEKAEISIITYGPGEQLYEKFGHTAIRVIDPTTKLDMLYNYGIFDFDAPNFYLKFIRGFMNYKLAKYHFFYALRSTKKDKRWMKEQILNLNSEQKNAFYAYLENNVLPENASYFYDPYFDNCSTKQIVILKSILGNQLVIPTDVSDKKSFRKIMNEEIHPNTWGSLGINIALGSKLDKATTSETSTYLPDYAFKTLEASSINNGTTSKPLVKKTKTLLNYKEKEVKSDTYNPLLIGFILMTLGLIITFFDYKKEKRSKWLDFIIFISTGFFGLLIIFLWFFTNHSTAPYNFNILWAIAPNIYVAFKLTQKNPPRWISKYIKYTLIVLLLIPIIWILQVQVLSIGLLPILILLGVRYFFLQKTLNS